MIEDLFSVEQLTYRKSFIHRLDARVKLVLTVAVIIAVVAFPYNRAVYYLGIFLGVFFLALWVISRLPITIYLRRLGIVLSLWLAVIFFQCFFENRFYSSFHSIVDLPFGIHMYAESVEFASFILVKFIISVSFIILLSSTTRVQDMLEGASRMGLPSEFALALGMMIRYLFVFAYMFRKINQAMDTRCFDPFNKTLPYRYRLRQVGYSIGTLFIRSYEQGERTFTSMVCRGYGRESHCYITKKPLAGTEMLFLCGSLSCIIGGTVGIFFLMI